MANYSVSKLGGFVKSKISAIVQITALTMFCSSVLLAQMPTTPEEQAALAQNYQDEAKPGPEHLKLAELAGNWNFQNKVWMSPFDTTSVVVEGKAEAKMILGGRFLELKGACSVMGIPYEELLMIGFDRRCSEYTTVRFDNMGTYSVATQGPADKETGQIVMEGKDIDPIEGIALKFKNILDIKDKDLFTFSVVFTDSVMSQGTGNFKMVEIVYNRVK
jgi:hypothetical protein